LYDIGFLYGALLWGIGGRKPEAEKKGGTL
jgi:hypothetical protein